MPYRIDRLEHGTFRSGTTIFRDIGSAIRTAWHVRRSGLVLMVVELGHAGRPPRTIMTFGAGQAGVPVLRRVLAAAPAKTGLHARA